MSIPSPSHTTDPSPPLGFAATQVARALRRPALAPIRISVLSAGGEAVVLSLVYWFVQYLALPTVHAGFAAVVAIGLAAMTGLAVTAFGGYRLLVLRRVSRGLKRLLPIYLLVLLMLGWVSGLNLTLVAVVLPFILGVVPTRLAWAKGIAWAIDHELTARRAVVAGGGADAEKLLRDLAHKPGNDVRVWGIFDDRTGERAPELTLNVPKIGRFEDLVLFCRHAEIDLIILTLPPSAEVRIQELLEMFRVLPVPVHFSAFSEDLSFPDEPEAQLLPASFRPERRLMKRAFDLVIGFAALIALSPIMVLAAVAIRLESRGPVFFLQERHGFNDSIIKVWKFRSMYTDQCDVRAEQVVTRGDPRITRVGRFLRRSSIDELPQLFNVLNGTLSLVGPRPHALDAKSSRQERFTQIVRGYSARHRLPPGVTGWAQINGWRGEIDDPESLENRFAHDLFYIENWSLLMDLKILLKTPWSLVATNKAY